MANLVTVEIDQRDIARFIGRLDAVDAVIMGRAIRMAAVMTSREIRRRYQRSLRMAAPTDTRRLRRSIRVRSRYSRGFIDITVNMIFYGRLLDRFQGRHHRWIRDVRDDIARQIAPVFQAALVDAINKLRIP